jgi:hypothetical protein
LFAAEKGSRSMNQITAKQALAQALELQKSARTQLYQQQAATFREQAQQAYREIIRPWWQEFAQSEQGARISLLVNAEDFMSEPKLRRPRISERVRYLREDGREWEAYVFLQGKPRALKLHVQQLPEGREPHGLAGNYYAHSQMRRIPLVAPELPDIDLHPIILIDFAEQISAKIVAAHIQQHLLNQAV